MPKVLEQLAEYSQGLEDEVMVKVGKLADAGWEEYAKAMKK